MVTTNGPGSVKERNALGLKRTDRYNNGTERYNNGTDKKTNTTVKERKDSGQKTKTVQVKARAAINLYPILRLSWPASLMLLSGRKQWSRAV